MGFTNVARFSGAGRKLSNALACLAVAGTAASVGCNTKNPMLHHVTSGLDALAAVETSGKPIPPEELKSCAGVALLECFQMGIVLGSMGGEGVAVKRLSTGWSSPVAIGVISGDFGALIGAQHIDLVMIFKNGADFDKFVTDGTYFAANASGTAGDATGSTQASGPPVKIFTTAAGLYGGASIGGLGVIVKTAANTDGYGAEATPLDILNGKYPLPPGGLQLTQKLDVASR
ncbi:MAG: hypothetical protein EXS03_03865 [Phycisphaerales bacterium]|nr:hypothetical protein [Phycisphaerales bacterium]